MELIARSPEEVREFILTTAIHGAPEVITKPHRGAIIGHLNEHLGGDDGRHLALAYLFEYLGRPKPNDSEYVITGLSTKSLDNDQWYALSKWIDAWQDEDGWHVSSIFRVECALVLTKAMQEYNAIPYKDKEEKIFERSFVEQLTAYMDGQITNISNEEGEFPDNSGVGLPGGIVDEDDLLGRPKKFEL